MASVATFGPINDLPKELLINHIFPNLTALELVEKIRLVCKFWNQLESLPSLWPASKLKELNCDVIDVATWQTHAPGIVSAEGVSFEGIIPLDYRLAIIKVARFYDRLSAAETSIEENAGVAILTIPKGLSINLVMTVFADRIDIISTVILRNLGEVKTDRVYRIIITKNVLIGSQEWVEFDEEFAQLAKAGCSRPRILEVMALALLTEKSTSVRLFEDNYTYCNESKLTLVVGGFGPSGLDIDEDIFGDIDGNLGVAGVQAIAS